METAINIEQVAAQAQMVASNAEDLAGAISTERDAEAAVLAAVIEAVRPALRALSSRIVAMSYETGGRNGCNPVSRTTYHDERGLVLVDDYERARDESGNRGDLTGRRLYLLTDGRLAYVAREGSFSQWQGEADHWESTLRIVTPRAAMNREKLDEVVGVIRAALDKQIEGQGETVAKAARARAAQLQAVAALVQS